MQDVTGDDAAAPRRKKIVIVDDSVAVADVLTMILQECGYEVETVENGDHAMELIDQYSPDLVITDIDHPGLDGLGLLQQIKRSRNSLPVVVLTASASCRNDCMTMGAFDFLCKPVDYSRLLSTLAAALSST